MRSNGGNGFHVRAVRLTIVIGTRLKSLKSLFLISALHILTRTPRTSVKLLL